jgi:bacterioferritin (cytochrome b1)
MKGNPKVMAGLQESINLEASRSAQYKLDGIDAKRFGLEIAGDLLTLHQQSEDAQDGLVSRLFFFEGEPEIAAQTAKPHQDFGSLIADHIAAETALVGRFRELAKEAWDAGEIDTAHSYEHLANYHTVGCAIGGNEHKGHLAWLQKQLWQRGKLGETDYIAVQAG